jgi:DNA-binding transcriptional ArsR family regulator
MVIEDHCEIEYVHKKDVSEVKSKIMKINVFSKVVERFKILSDPTKIKILFALSQKELCVCDIAASVSMSQSAVSHQLRILRNSNLAKRRKEGKMMYYSLADEHVMKLIDIGIKHAKE